MSRYGQKFDKRLGKALKYRKGRIIALSIVFSVLTAISILVIVAMSLNFLTQNEETVRLSVIAFVISAVLLPFFIYILCSNIYHYIGYLRLYIKVKNRTLRIAAYFGQDAEKLSNEFNKRKKAHDREWILKVTDYYYDECERLKAEHIANAGKEELENGGEGGFDGWLLQKIGWMLLGIVITVCTAGIGFPVAYILVLRWQYKHSLYDGKRLCFDGKVSQLMGKWVCWLLLCIPTALIFALFIPKKLLQWKASHTHLAGELPFLGGTWRGNAIVLLLVKLGCSLFTLITLWLLKPLAICWKNRYIQKRLVIDGRRMRFDGNGVQILGNWILWTLLTCITLGIYGFFRNLRVLRWVNKHTRIQDGYQQIKVL